MSMYTGRLMVRVHNAYAEVYNWSRTSSKTILKIAYNQSAMGFSFSLQFGLGSSKIHLKKWVTLWRKHGKDQLRSLLNYPDRPDLSIS